MFGLRLVFHREIKFSNVVLELHFVACFRTAGREEAGVGEKEFFHKPSLF